MRDYTGSNPMAPENLPKGMKMKHPCMDYQELSQVDKNYSGMILGALQSIEEFKVNVLRMEVIEEKDMRPTITLIVEVEKGEE